jgi:hypothetical protein
MSTFVIRPLSPKEHKMFSDLAVGTTTCPDCKQDDVIVVNDNGTKGSEANSYLANHCPKDGKELCTGSRKLVSEL